MSHTKILYGSTEFYSNINNKKYYIYIINNDINEEYMVKIFNNFITNQDNNINEKHYIGIDFEFNKISKTNRDVALMQINLENNSNTGYIFLLCPEKLKFSYELLIKLITQPNMIKILHGCESLDIQYVFNQLLITLDNINNFCSNFYDTKFLCEYKNEIKLYKLKNINKCSIYDVLLDDKIISQEQSDKLNKIDEDMGPIYLIHIDVYNLTEILIDYSLYDVLYLPELLKKNLKELNNEHLIISELLKIIFLYKRNIDHTFLKLELTINSINNNFIFESKKHINLNDIWIDYYDYMTDIKYISILKNINYFKSFFKIISKYILYYNIYNVCPIYKSSNNKINIDNFNYFPWLKKYKHIYPLILNINNIILYDIKKWYL